MFLLAIRVPRKEFWTTEDYAQISLKAPASKSREIEKRALWEKNLTFLETNYK